MRKDNPYYKRGRPSWQARQWETKMLNLGEFVESTTHTAKLGETTYDCEARRHEKGYELIYGQHFELLTIPNCDL